MPNAKVHHELWKKNQAPALVLTASVGLGVKLMGAPTDAVLVLLGTAVTGYALGKYLSPDLDLVSVDHAEALLIKSVILLPLVAWTTLYARVMQVFGGHRSLWSHLPIFSTFIRLCWMLFPLVILAGSFGMLQYDFSTAFLGLWFGLSIADTIHAAADYYGHLRNKASRKRRFSRGSKQTGDC